MHRVVLLALLAVPVTACHEDHAFHDLPECVDDHIDLGEVESIAHCLYDFPELHPEFADVQECVDWVEDNGGYEDSRQEACEIYFDEIGR